LIKDYEILKEQINYSIQNCNLDIGAVYFITKDIFHNLEKLYYAQINREYIDESKKKQESQSQLNTDSKDE